MTTPPSTNPPVNPVKVRLYIEGLTVEALRQRGENFLPYLSKRVKEALEPLGIGDTTAHVLRQCNEVHFAITGGPVFNYDDVGDAHRWVDYYAEYSGLKPLPTLAPDQEAEGAATFHADLEEAVDKDILGYSRAEPPKAPTRRDKLIASLEAAGVMSISPEWLEETLRQGEIAQSASYIPGAEGLEVVVNLNSAVPTEYQVETANEIYALLEKKFNDAGHGTIRFGINYVGQVKKNDDDLEAENVIAFIKDVAQGATGFVFTTSSGSKYTVSRYGTEVELALRAAVGTVTVVTADADHSPAFLTGLGDVLAEGVKVRFMLLDEYDHLMNPNRTGEADPVFAGQAFASPEVEESFLNSLRQDHTCGKAGRAL